MTEKSSLKRFAEYLREREKSPATLQKYLRDVRGFLDFAAGRRIGKSDVMEYKEYLAQRYAVTSANSMLAALNSYFRFCRRDELCVRQFRLQKSAYRDAGRELTREEYGRLVRAAEQGRGKRLSLVVQTICGTGIRVSELAFITVEAARRGEATVSCKGKTRRIFIVRALQKKLIGYAAEQGIARGPVFVTRGGKPVDRSNIWREMKSLCRRAGVAPEKVFPHNLRHLFARTFYGLEKDIAKLADILGHSSINTTRIYIITTGEEHRRRMENMHLII